MTDWEEVKVRLETFQYRYYLLPEDQRQLCNDIRAALQRVKELERQARLREIDCANETARANDAERKLRLREADYRALEDDACKMETKLAKVVEALKAMVIVMESGQPCYRTGNGIPQGMPRKVERVVRAALATAKGECFACRGSGRMPDTQDVVTGAVRQHTCRACGGSGIAVAKGE